jgi:hypothetical protein
MTAVFAGTKAERCRARDYLQVRVVRVDKYQVPHCWCTLLVQLPLVVYTHQSSDSHSH